MPSNSVPNQSTPRPTLTVIFTGDWFMPNEEANAVTTLADQGIDVVSGHIDSPKVLIQTADEARQACLAAAITSDGSALSPKLYLTGAEWNWGDMYVKFVNAARDGKPLPRNEMGSIKDGAVKLSAYGPAVSDATKTAVDAIKAKMVRRHISYVCRPDQGQQRQCGFPRRKDHRRSGSLTLGDELPG